MRFWLPLLFAANQKAAYRFVAAHHPPMSAVFSRQNFPDGSKLDEFELAAAVH